MNDVMIDIETLDTRPTAVILSIAAVRFDSMTQAPLGESFQCHVDIDSNLKWGRTISGSTLLWWLGQDEEARRSVTDATTIPLGEALHQLRSFIKDTDRVWSNGASFDVAILSDAYRAAGTDTPWRFWNDRCYKTLKNLHPEVPKPEFVGVKHNALDDAKFQAVHTQNIMRKKDLADLGRFSEFKA